MITKVVINGHWIYDPNDGWHLAVHPLVTLVSGQDWICGSFQLINGPEIDLPPCKIPALDHLLASTKKVYNTTLYNLGEIVDEESQEPISIILLCKEADIKDNPNHPVIMVDGFVYMADIQVDNEPEAFNRHALGLLNNLTAPHSINFSK